MKVLNYKDSSTKKNIFWSSWLLIQNYLLSFHRFLAWQSISRRIINISHPLWQKYASPLKCFSALDSLFNRIQSKNYKANSKYYVLKNIMYPYSFPKSSPLKYINNIILFFQRMLKQEKTHFSIVHMQKCDVLFACIHAYIWTHI